MRQNRKWVAIGVCAIAGWGMLAASSQAAPPDDARQLEIQLRPFLAKHCLECHQGEKPEGQLRLDTLPLKLEDATAREHWANVLDRLRSGEMPPKEKPRPPQAEVHALLQWLSPRVAAADAAARAAEGRVVLRRLNRTEYERTINDLLGIQASLREQLPADGSADGFDNAGAAHHTSSFLMEKYLEAADIALNMAISNRPKAPPLVSKKCSIKEGHPIRSTTEDVYRFSDDGEVVCFCSSEWHNVSVPHLYPQEAGDYRFRIAFKAIQSEGKPVMFRLTSGGTRLSGTSGLVGYYDALPDKQTVLEFVRHMEPRTTLGMLPYGLAGAQQVKQVGGKDWTGPGLAIEYVEFEGPLNEQWPPASHQRLFGNLSQKNFKIYNFSDRVEVVSDQPREDATAILMKFTRRAFRRAITAADIAPFLEVFQAKLDGGYTFEMAMRAALKGVLISPEFLFLREQPGKLDDYALACRLSYFLWSTMPDDELFALADNKQLSQPAVLRSQVERMLADPKASAFTVNFVGQWLSLREIDATEPSHILYPEFDHLLKVSMIKETELFFDELLKNDLSIANFVSSDFTMLNGRLAKHYGIPGIEGWTFQKVPLPADSHRGGVMTMASVMKVTANGTTTSPVLRGAWILDHILGTPPPPPPDNVSAIDPDIRGATTIREQLAKHREVESCGICHRKIDPPGFALESFDCIGGWRDEYRVTGTGRSVEVNGRRMSYHIGKKVDPSDVMPDGEKFENVDQFKVLLLRDKPQLARSLTAKLMAYATGRALQPSDRAALEPIVSRLAAKDYGLRSLVHEVVQSDVFKNK